MPTKKISDHVVDVRPDPYDIRDRVYSPQLIQLPPQFPGKKWLEVLLPVYAGRHVLDQGAEGACTGFGLAAVIRYLLFAERYRDLQSTDTLVSDDPDASNVSPYMLYLLAQLYDEWQGEDYQGSSCRGAMKGWHKHGACHQSFWGKEGPSEPLITADPQWSQPAPTPAWQLDAARRPLGAYYRIEKHDVRDLQSAIHQVGAVYVSANVHAGWMTDSIASAADHHVLKRTRHSALPIIPLSNQGSGCHAFAIIGYNERGFILQNSWGLDWGKSGFAILTYEDWTTNAVDAWVATLGAPVSLGPAPKLGELKSANISQDSNSISQRGGYLLGEGESLTSINVQAISKSCLNQQGKATEKQPVQENQPADQSWVETVSLRAGNDGRPLRSLIHTGTAADHYRIISYDRPLKALKKMKQPRIVLYFHGGLNSEEASSQRARVMAPVFYANGIYPIFYSWKTGLRETLLNIAEDAVRDYADHVSGPIRNMLQNFREAAAERIDRFVETFCRQSGPKALWAEMKENAERAADSGGALKQIAANFADLRVELGEKLEIHLVGHSAGSLPAGHLLRLFGLASMENVATSCTLWAPACSLSFFNQRFMPALEQGVLESLRVDNLSDALERNDRIAKVYGKSLLYLVSRALERSHKEPILGLTRVWQDKQVGKDLDDMWREEGDNPEILPREFRKFPNRKEQIESNIDFHVHATPEVTISPGKSISRSHGSFDNDVDIFNQLLQRICGGKPAFPVTNLDFENQAGKEIRAALLGTSH